MDKGKLTLKNAKVIFFNPVDEGFGTTITIDATDEEVRKNITAWVEENKIGKNPGVPKFKTYKPDDGEETVQFSFNLNDKTKYGSTEGLTKDDIGWGAVVDITARAYEWDNKFGKGVSQSVSAVVIRKGASTGNDEDLAELLGEQGEEEKPLTVDSVPF